MPAGKGIRREEGSEEGTLAFVPPRFGSDVVGGAEAVVAETAVALAARGWDVEILTTCARDHYTWANSLPRRAKVPRARGHRSDDSQPSRPRRNKRGDQIGGRILAREAVPIQDQQVWMNSGLRVPDLWHHLLDHRTSYRAVVVAPYMFWTSFACGQIAPERTIVMPCLHDEPFAYLDSVPAPDQRGRRCVVPL